MEKNAQAAPVGLLEKRAKAWIGQRGTGEVALQDDSVELELVQRPLEFLKRSVGRIHRYGSEPFEPCRVGSDQLRVSIVEAPGQVGLMIRVREKNVRG